MKAAITLLVMLLLPSRLLAPAAVVERPATVLAWHKLGLPEPSLMARLVLVESNGNPQAVSSKGAVGLCQIMPSLARGLGADPSRLMDAEYNLTLGARWLGVLIQRYGVDGALRAYLMGETNKAGWYCHEANEYVRRILG